MVHAAVFVVERRWSAGVSVWVRGVAGHGRVSPVLDVLCTRLVRLLLLYLVRVP